MRRFLSMILVFFIVILLPNISMAQIERDPKPVDLKTELFLGPLKAYEEVDFDLAVKYLGQITSIKSLKYDKIIYRAKDGTSDKATKLVSNLKKSYLDVKFEKGSMKLIGNTIYSISTSCDSLKTSRGIKVGDNLMTLIEAYGLPLKTNHFRSEPHIFAETETGYFFTYSSDPYVYFIFEIDRNAIIKNIEIGISRSI